MLKWLRKYNTYILVVGGCLLMVAFLLQGVLNDLAKHGMFGGSAFKIGSRKVGVEEYQKAGLEYAAIGMVLDSTGFFGGRAGVAAIGGGEDAKHWYLLTHQAAEAGLVGGVKDGSEYLDELATAIAAQVASRQRMGGDIEIYRSIIKAGMDKGFEPAAGQAHMTKDDLYRAFAKLRGAVRLQNLLTNSTRYGLRRLATESRATADMVTADYVLIPAEREIAGIPEPTEEQIKAHYEKFKSTPKGGGDFGIGYTLPPRIKLEWLELNYQAISDALSIDPVEVEKRFVTKYADGKVPDGKTPEGERTVIENEVRRELAAKAMKFAEQVVRNEIDKPLRKIDRDGDFYKLPADWNTRRPDFAAIRELVAKRLNEQFKITVPAPKVVVRASNWIEQAEAGMLEGISSSYIRRPAGARTASNVLFAVRELGENSEFTYQTGVPFPETLDGNAGNKYFFTILDARKESPPDSMDDIRPTIVANIKRLAAYDKLKAMETSLRAAAVSGGLEAVAKAPEGSQLPLLPIQQFSTSKTQTISAEANNGRALDTQAFRDAVIAQTGNLDPLSDISKIDAAARTFSAPVDKALGLCIFKVKELSPLTAERFRQSQRYLVDQANRDELKLDQDTFPFSFDAMKARLKVTDSEGGEIKTERKKDKPKK